MSAAWHTEDEEYLDNGHCKELGALWEVFKEDDVSSHTNLKQAVDAAFETVSEFTSVQRADFVASFMTAAFGRVRSAIMTPVCLK